MKKNQNALILLCGILCSLTAQSQFKSQLFVGPGYMQTDVGDDVSSGVFGVTGVYTWKFARKWGIILDAGYYSHADIVGSGIDVNRYFLLSGGFSYHPGTHFKNNRLSLSAHALVGFTRYSSLYNYSIYEAAKYVDYAPHVFLGGALDYQLNSIFSLRLIQLDLNTTFYSEADPQGNIRISTGLSINFPHS